jgi:hypothetical protein
MNSSHNWEIKGIFFSWMLFISPFVHGASVVAPQISGEYAAKILIDQCDRSVCQGRASISLFSLRTNEKIADLDSDDFKISVNGNSRSNNSLIADADGGGIVIGDFNFDGYDDIAIMNGYNGSYGYVSYDVYTYDAIRRAYSLNLDLTRLAGGEYLGMFHVDKKRKRLLAFNKAADGITFSFEFISDIRGVKKSCEKSEIWDMPNHMVNVTVKTLKNNTWLTRKRSFSDAHYDFKKMAEFGKCSSLSQ